MLEVEGPTSADAGVTSCLLFDAEPVFRCLRDDLFDIKILVGMIRRGGNELQKGSVGNLSLWCFRGADVSWNFTVEKRRDKLEQSDSSSTAEVVTVGKKAKHEKFSTAKDF